MVVQNTVYYVLIITAIISVALVFINKKLTSFNSLDKPKGIVLLMMMGVDAIENMLLDKTNPEITKQLTTYFCSTFIYIFLANISGLLAFETPTSNLSVTVALALITCILIEYYSIKYNGPKNYFKSLLEPFAPFLILNLLGKVSTLLSLSLRLFGNIIAGSVLMNVLYQMFAAISRFIPLIGNINIFGIALAPFFHFYFDLFAGAMQAYLFTMLSISFIGKELPKED